MNPGCCSDDSDVISAASGADFSTTVNQLYQYVNSGSRSDIEDGGISLIMHKAIQLAENQTALSIVDDLISQYPPSTVPADVTDALGCALLRAGQVTSALAIFQTAVSASEHACAAQRLKLYVHLCDAYARLEKPRQVVRYGTQAVHLVEAEVLTATMREDLYELYDLLTKAEQALNRFQKAKYWLKLSLRHMSSERLPYSSPTSPTGSSTCPGHSQGKPTLSGFSEALHRLSIGKEKTISSERHSPESAHVLFQCWRKLPPTKIVKVSITEDQEDNWVVTMTDSNDQVMQRRILTRSDPWRKLQPRMIATMVRLDSKGDLVLRPVLKLNQPREPASRDKYAKAARGQFPLHKDMSAASLHRSTKAISPGLFEFSPRRRVIRAQSRRIIPLLKVPQKGQRTTSTTSRRHCASGSSSPDSHYVQDRVVMATTRNDTKRFIIHISEALEDSTETNIRQSL